jgi:phage shock protein A
MSVMRRMSDVVQEKLNAILGRVEDPSEAIDLAYEKQLESLQQVRRSVADVLTSEKRLELQAAELRQSQQKLQAQAREALAQGREDLARLALARAQSVQAQLGGLDAQVQQLKDQEQKLELTAQKLQAKVEAFRTQKETIKAEYSAAQASTRIGEAVTGLSEQMADVSLMVDRAQEKTKQLQARSAAIDQLIDSGALDQIGAGTQDDIDRQLQAASADTAVETRLQALKQQLAAPPAPAQLPAATFIVRVLGGDLYELGPDARAELDARDQKLFQALDAGDAGTFETALAEAIAFVKARGTELPAADLRKSELVLPAPDTSLEDARKLLAAGVASG